MANQPQNYINRANLGISIADNWANFFPNYQVNFCTQSTFKQLFADFSAQAMLNSQQDALKKNNTQNLKTVNEQITKGTVRLKEYIRDTYNTNIDAMYAAYGLVKNGKNAYSFPFENDNRGQRLAILLQKLNEPNDPIATRTQGLVYWQGLITTHATEWASSKNLKSQKAQLSQNCKALHKQAGEWLQKIHRQLAIDNDKSTIDTVRRTFGFLNETY